MGCEICGRNNCTRSFHSLDDQEAFDNVGNKVKDNIKSSLENKVSRLEGHYHGDNYYVRLEDVIKLIDNID